MAKNREIDTMGLLLNEYTTEEIIAWLSKELSAIVFRLDNHIQNGEPARLYLEMSNVLRVSEALKGLDKKLNGDKKQSVL